MERPLISVLIPTYNVELYVEEAIRSIMNQTYKNLEIIVVDDGSTDKTLQILKKLSNEDERIFIYKNEKNQRIVNTLNTAFKKSKGDFIARMDGDDISLSDRIEKQLLHLESNLNTSLVGLNVIMIDEVGNRIHKESYITGFENILKAIPYASPIPHFWLARRKVYEDVGNYRIATAEDYDFILRCIDKGYIVDNLPEYLYLQRMRGGNTATASGLIQRKSISYIRKLHAERMLSVDKTDSYSIENLESFLKANFFEKNMFKISSNLHFKYITVKNRFKLLAVLYRFGSVMFAPIEQIKDIYNRWQYGKIKLNSLKRMSN